MTYKTISLEEYKGVEKMILTLIKQKSPIINDNFAIHVTLGDFFHGTLVRVEKEFDPEIRISKWKIINKVRI